MNIQQKHDIDQNQLAEEQKMPLKRIHVVLFVACLIVLLLDFAINRYTYHAWEEVWGFYAFYGFFACVILVVAAKWMRKVVMRSPDYYDRDEIPGRGQGSRNPE